MDNKKITEEDYTTKINGNTEDVLLGLKKSSQKIADIVSQTAGPLGHNVVLKTGKNMRITKDGISVLRWMVAPENDFDEIALNVIRSASDETNRKAGDGTTATCILANEVFQRGHQFLTAGMNGNKLRNGILKASELAQKIVEENIADKVGTNKDIYNVAKISSNGSDEIAGILTDVFSKIGKDGTAHVEMSRTDKTSYKVVSGMNFNNGYCSAYFINNEHGEVVLENPIILMANKRLTVLGELLKPFDAMAKYNRPILVIADGYDPDILNTFVVNKLKGLPICVVEAPAYGDYRTAMLGDIALVTGGKVISPATGLTLNSVIEDPSILGSAKQVIVTDKTTSIVTDPSCVDSDALNKKIAELTHMIEDENTNDHDRNILKTRRARLASGIGIISVGGATEAEMCEKKDLVDDAFASVSSSLKSGIVPGSGLTYLSIHDYLYGWIEQNMSTMSQEEASGFKIFADSLERPFLTICDNGNGNSQFLLGCVQSANRATMEKSSNSGLKWTRGVDISSGEDIDVLECGIIDSAAAVIETLKNGASAGAQLLSLSGIVSTKLPPQPQQSQM